MNNCIFISEDYLKQNTIINGNVDNKYLLANLKMVEDVQIHPILGTNLYNSLKQKIISNNTSGDVQVLIEDYIQPALIYWLQTELPVDMLFKWENKAIVRKNSDNSQSVDLSELRFIIDKKDKIARFYSQRLIDYLKANTDKFPEYLNHSSTADSIKPVRNPYNYGGMYLGNGRRRHNHDCKNC